MSDPLEIANTGVLSWARVRGYDVTSEKILGLWQGSRGTHGTHLTMASKLPGVTSVIFKSVTLKLMLMA